MCHLYHLQQQLVSCVLKLTHIEKKWALKWPQNVRQEQAIDSAVTKLCCRTRLYKWKMMSGFQLWMVQYHLPLVFLVNFEKSGFLAPPLVIPRTIIMGLSVFSPNKSCNYENGQVQGTHDDENEKFTCDICGLRFRSLRSYKEHRQRYHNRR